MILQQLDLANFRGFEQITLTFDPRVTVIAGANGVGKSGILHALRVMFCQALPQFTPARTLRKAPSFSDEDICYGRSMVTVSMCVQHAGVAMEAVGTRARVEASVMLPDSLQHVDDQYQLLLAGIDDQSPDRILRQMRASGDAPLAILFTPNRQLSERPRTLASPAPFEPASAYVDALSERSLRLGDFMAWFNMLQNLPGKGQKRRRRLLNRMKDVVTTFIPEFRDLRIESEPQLRFVVDKESTDRHGAMIRTPLSFHQLSDGERGLLAMLFDITRRLVIANPESDDPVSEGSAVVLIDEIELHLHPMWQRRVLKRFTETFRNCQFIVTTHSPLVLGEVPNTAIRFLYRSEGKVQAWTPEHAWGLDANRVLEDLMGVPSRDSETAQRLHELAQAIDREEFSAAQTLMTQLEGQLGDDPDLVRSRALMAFLEGRE